MPERMNYNVFVGGRLTLVQTIIEYDDIWNMMTYGILSLTEYSVLYNGMFYVTLCTMNCRPSRQAAWKWR